MKKIILIMITLLSPIYVACGDSTVTFVNDTGDDYYVIPFNEEYPEVVLYPGEQGTFACHPLRSSFIIRKTTAHVSRSIFAKARCDQGTITIEDLVRQLEDRIRYN